MRWYFSPLAVTLALLFACSSQAAEKPRPAQSNQNQPKKVWTNDDMEEFSARGLISIVGQEAPAPPTQKPAGPAESGPTFPVYESRLDDPEWYADQAAILQVELDKRMADLQQQQEALAAVKDRITQPGLALDKPDAGVTPAAGLANLEAQVQETQSQLDELSELARQHNIPPGVLRS
jgi:hypothetical protein